MRNLLVAGFCALALAAVTPVQAGAEPKPGPKPSGFRLFARSLGALTINRIYCGLASDGRICVDSLNSSTIGGGFWPKGTADQYVFNTGLQIAGIIGPEMADWAGDTTGAFFFDPKGTTEHGQEVEPIYNTSDPEDAAFIGDTTVTCNEVCQAAKVPSGDVTEELFFPLLRGRTSASQGDVWWLSWDGNPAQSTGRPHPLGVLVEQRGMGWNFPSGNQDIVYFLYTFYNVTARDPAVYAASGVRPGMREILARQGAIFQDRNEAAFGVDVPDGGYSIGNLFAAFSADMDVANARTNYASVNVPFALGHTYDQSFSASPGWTFDPAIFSPPFFPGAGFVGVKYLRSPVGPTGEEVGLTLFSNTINGGAFDDAQQTTQLFRYISNNISPAAGDAPCNTGDPQVSRICFINNAAAADMRFFQSSGPLNLGPGQFGTIAVAYIFAAPVLTGSCTGPGTCNLTPGDPRLLSDPATADNANPVDSVAGFTGYAGDADGDGEADQGEFTLPVPGSLMGKALVAQAVFDLGFLLPFAPDAPDFFLVPGDNQVTVLWRPSPSETTGDPFFEVASALTVPNPETGAPEPNPLYDPNYRQSDVEGYRIYRGRVDSPTELALVAQFDYSGTFITDWRGQVNPVPGCAPELGIDTACAVPFDSAQAGVAPTVSVDIPLAGEITQVKLGDRVALATGEAILLAADTALTGEGAGNPALEDTGVPFTFVDQGVRSNLRYFYSVTAFDVNSFQSGPSSIESPRNTKPVTPTALASNFQNVATSTTSLVGRGQVLDTTAPLPTIDPATGTFSGPFPPANGWDVGLQEIVSQVLVGETQVSALLDSIQLGSPSQPEGPGGVPHRYWFTASAGGSTAVLSVAVLIAEEIGVTQGSGSSPPVVAVDQSRSSTFGGSAEFKLTTTASLSFPGSDYLALYGRGCVNAAIGRPGFGDGTRCPYNGSRWFDGPSPTTNETQAHPIAGNTQNFSGIPMPNHNNAGALSGVTTIYQTQCYQSAGGADCRGLATIQSGAKRGADFNVYWGAGGLVDSVVDVTHNVLVPFDTRAGGTWGILNQAATGVGPSRDASTTLTNADFSCVEPFYTYRVGGFLCADGTPAYQLSNTAVPGAVGFFSGGAYPPTVPIVAGADPGFAMYIAGDMFTFELTGGALPAAGTAWALRQYTGAIVGGQGAAGDLGPSEFSHPERIRPMNAVGAELVATVNVTNQAVATTDDDLSRVHTVPDPYYVTSQFEQTTDTKIIKFVNLPADCIIRIYSSSGVLVDLVEHHSAQFGGSEDWNVRNRNNQVVASGVYFYHIESGDARRVGRFTIVNFAQ
ncbi:MAG: hypothetical protein ACREMZ_08405 [Gemmatimonadales bacterium]